MRLHRFYVNKPLGEEIVVESAGSEKEILHQWLHVFRYKPGDDVLLFSSHSVGSDILYRITSVDKGEALLSRVSTVPHIVPKSDITLVMALVKKDTFETVVRQATELGVSRIIPLMAARSEKKALNMERLEKIAVEASEQSGRGTVPVISPIMTLDETLESTKTQRNIVGSLHGEQFTSLANEPLCLWVGPEGGWADEEEKYFTDQGFFLMRSVATTLKADTAAVNLLSLLTGYSS